MKVDEKVMNRISRSKGSAGFNCFMFVLNLNPLNSISENFSSSTGCGVWT